MLYSIKKRDVLQTLEELASLQNEVKDLRSRGKLGKQNFIENKEKVFEPVTNTIKDSSQDMTKLSRKRLLRTTKQFQI